MSDMEALRCLVENDGVFQRAGVESPCHIRFQAAGVPFEAFYVQEKESIRLQFLGTLGYVPFTVESAARRRLLIAVLRSLPRTETAHFALNEAYQITVSGVFYLAAIQPPLFIFQALMSFLQETMPYIALVGELI